MQHLQTAVAGRAIETLESRRLLAAFVVDTLLDGPLDPLDGVLTLREALAAANDSLADDDITFAVSGTITLDPAEGQLEANAAGALSIDGANGITLDALGNSRHLEIADDADVLLSGLSFVNGDANGGDAAGSADAGAVFAGVGSTLQVVDSTFADNRAADGGAIRSNGLLFLRFTDFTNNVAQDPTGLSGGGAIQSFGTGVSITGGTFEGNSARFNDPATDAAQGGAIWASLNLVGESMVIDLATFIGNTASTGGGAIRYFGPPAQGVLPPLGLRVGDAPVAAGDSIDSDINRARFAEMSDVDDLSNRLRRMPDDIVGANPPRLQAGPTLEIINTSFLDNSTPALGGAALFSDGDINIVSSRFVGNASTGVVGDAGGGGAFFAFDADWSILDSEFSFNRADNQAERFIPGGDPFGSASAVNGFGGAINAQFNDDRTAELQIVQSTFSQNLADSRSAVSVASFSVAQYNLQIQQSTIAFNGEIETSYGEFTRARGAGAVGFQRQDLDAGVTVLRNTILAGNVGEQDPDPAVDTDGDNIPNNDFEPVVFNGGGFSAVIDSSIFGTDLLFAGAPAPLATDAPLLGPLGFNGGSTRNHEPLIGSLAINAGTDAFAVDPGFDNELGTADDDVLIADQRTAQRVIYGQVDIGAVEFRLPGDANLDGTVNLSDFLILRRNFGQPWAFFESGDFNNDGRVNLSDFLILRRNFGESVDVVLPGDQ
jgi:hypothetical protein